MTPSGNATREGVGTPLYYNQSHYNTSYHTMYCIVLCCIGGCITMYGITMYGKRIEGDWCGSSNPPREPLRCQPLDAVEPAFQRSDCRLSLDKLE